MTTPRPPRLTEWVLHRAIRQVDRDAVAGDLYEEFGMRASRDGPGPARRWYRRQVRRSIGHLLRDRVAQRANRPSPAGRAARSRSVGADGWRDLRLAVRSLKSTPTVTSVVLVVLMLGVGATTAIFSVVDAVVLRGLPFPHDDRLVALSEPAITYGGTGVSAPEFHDWSTQQTTFEHLAASRGTGRGAFILQDASDMENLRVLAVSASLFPVLEVAPALGRVFVPDDEVRGREQVAVLSDAFWRRRFGADPHIVGRTLTLANGVWTIVGVMPPSFMYPAAIRVPMDMWVPYVADPADLIRGTTRSFDLQLIGRLKDGVSIDQARADIERITGGLRQSTPRWFRGRGVNVVSLQESIVGRVKSWMLMLLAAVAFVLLIACVNVANLLLARATARSRDAAVRAALGASRWRILQGLFAESLVLSVTGTALGLALAVWAVHVLRASLPPSLPRLNQVAVNYRVLVGAATTAFAVALGVTPIWQTSSPEHLHDSGRSGAAGVRRLRLRSALLVVEVALAVVLLVGSGLFISSFVRVIDVNLGFETGHVLSVDLSPHTGTTDAALSRAATTAAAAMDQIRRLPGVQAIAVVSGTPPLQTGDDRTAVTVPGKPRFNDPDDWADDKLTTPGYFSVLGVPLLRGRSFVDADSQEGAPEVVLLNDIAARRYFGAENPVGARIVVGTDSRTVVGVVRAVRLEGPEADLRPEVYTPLDWEHFHGSPVLTLVLRTAGNPAELALQVRAVVHAVAPDLAVPSAETYDQLFDAFVAQRKFNMVVLLLFGVLAITIAAVGIYGVMTYVVDQRTAEIGVRMALGADPTRVVRMVLTRAIGTITVGLALGLTAGWLLSRFVQAFLFQMSAHDPVVYLSVGALLAATGIVAALAPARRAARVDPVIALRAQ